MPLVYYVPEYERDASQTPLDAERLLRLLGVSGKLTGFRYAVYMVEQVRDQPENMILITKRLYAQHKRRRIFRPRPAASSAISARLFRAVGIILTTAF